VTDKNKYCGKRHMRKRVTIPYLVFLIVILMWSGTVYAQQRGDYSQASYLKFYNEAGQQTSEVSVGKPQKPHSKQTAKLQKQANDLRNRFHQEVTRWGNAYQYHNLYNGVSYPLDYEYNQVQGFGADVDRAVEHAHKVSDYQAAIKLITSNLTHLHAMEADAADKTLWFHAHASDVGLIRYYHLAGIIVVVSFIEQACRIYQNGKLIKAFRVTTGNFDSPSPVGLWHIFLRQSPTVFRSSAPVGSHFWYPDTPINFAMEYHIGGYYLHDSWWRTSYGPGTNFPHYDPNGNRYAAEGSHGCINMPYADAAWMYANTRYGTAVITY
jgi:L,D-transpeptidase catalytic domain